MQAFSFSRHMVTYCIPLLIMVFICGCLHGKSMSLEERVEYCDNISQKVFEALNAQNPKAIKGYLALNFTFVGQKWPFAKLIFNGMAEEMGGTYTNIKRINEDLEKGVLTLTYEYLFSLDSEEKTTTASFRFKKSNNIVEIVFHMFKDVKVEVSDESDPENEIFTDTEGDEIDADDESGSEDEIDADGESLQTVGDDGNCPEYLRP